MFRILLLLLSTQIWAQELQFKNNGTLVRKISLEQLQKLAPVQEIKVYEPHELRTKTYVGLFANAIFDSIYGKSWKTSEEALFTCSDGYQPSIPVSRFTNHKAFLVFKIQNSDHFSINNKLNNNETSELGPLYLVWDNLNDSFVKMLGGTDWPYKIVSFDFIKFSDRFPKMSPPSASSAAVKRGFEGFRQFCMSCHTINSEGGAKAMDLNLPRSVTEYRSEEWLKKWISKPTSIRKETKMPAINANLPNRKQVISDIIAYLKAMAKSHEH